MIYLEKGKANAETDSEELALVFEEQGFIRLTGRKRFGKVLINACKKTAKHYGIPMLAAGVMYRTMGGSEFVLFVIGVFTFSVVRECFD